MKPESSKTTAYEKLFRRMGLFDTITFYLYGNLIERLLILTDAHAYLVTVVSFKCRLRNQLLKCRD